MYVADILTATLTSTGPHTADLPVIVLTAKGDEDNEVRVFELGANDFLTKPFRPRALTARLRALLRTH